MSTVRLGNRQRQALELIARHDGEKFKFPWRQTPSQARAFDDRLERLEELGLITGLRRLAFFASIDEVMAGSLFGHPNAWSASITPAGRALLDN